MAEIRNPNHDHPLKLQPRLYQEIYCYGCDTCTVEDEPYYDCKHCPFKLHKTCASLPQQIPSHFFHPQHTLSLLSHPPDSVRYQCHACLKNNEGFTFNCADCNFNLDLCCSQLIPKGVVNEENEFDGKSHSWIICNRGDKFKVLCSACTLPVENPIYVCLECKLLMHKSCTLLPKTIRHPFHERHSTLELTRWVGNKGNGLCNVCYGNLDDSIGYSCHKCDFQLDMKCASLVAKTYEFHGHPLVLMPTRGPFICDNCNCKDCVPMLHCIEEDCQFDLHLHCVPSLPRLVKYEGHVHSLNLTNNEVKDHDDEEGHEEFYCDACEELRLLPDPTYYCEECHYVAHVRCLISDEDLLAMGNEYSVIGQREDGASQGSSSDVAGTEMGKEVDSIISEIRALIAKLGKLKQKRAREAKFLALCEDPNYVVDLDA